MGPVIGGALARPCHSFPTVFSSGSLFDHFPFLLPNLVCAAVLAIGVLVGVLFLEETHQEKKYSRDGGLEAGKWILSRFCKRPSFRGSNKAEDAYLEVSRPLLEDEPPPGYRTTEGSPRYPLSRSHSPCAPLSTCEKKGRARGSMNLRGIETAFTRQVIIYIISYGILA